MVGICPDFIYYNPKYSEFHHVINAPYKVLKSTDSKADSSKYFLINYQDIIFIIVSRETVKKLHMLLYDRLFHKSKLLKYVTSGRTYDEKAN